MNKRIIQNRKNEPQLTENMKKNIQGGNQGAEVQLKLLTPSFFRITDAIFFITMKK